MIFISAIFILCYFVYLRIIKKCDKLKLMMFKFLFLSIAFLPIYTFYKLINCIKKLEFYITGGFLSISKNFEFKAE